MELEQIIAQSTNQCCQELLTVIIVGDGKNVPAQLVITGKETLVQKTGSRYVSQL